MYLTHMRKASCGEGSHSLATSRNFFGMTLKQSNLMSNQRRDKNLPPIVGERPNMHMREEPVSKTKKKSKFKSYYVEPRRNSQLPVTSNYPPEAAPGPLAPIKTADDSRSDEEQRDVVILPVIA
jgi:hypothetical protein